MEKFISNLEARANYKNIKAGFKWNNIPKFAVITGENGSGKTALLDQIKSLDSRNILLGERRYVPRDSIFSKHITSTIQYYNNITLENKHYNHQHLSITSLERVMDFVLSDNSYNEANTKLKERFNKTISIEEFIKGDLKNFSEEECHLIRSYKQKIDTHLSPYEKFLKRHSADTKDLLLMNKNEMKQWLNSLNDINLDSKPTIFDEQLLVNIFGYYFIKYTNHKKEFEKQYPQKRVYEISEELEKKIGEDPLIKINTILQQYYPKYEIEVTRDLSDKLCLICVNRWNKERISLDQLSLGEQIIISLVLWQYENTTLDSVILLLDEPDAHLNPKMAKMLIDILKNIVVKKFGCQVIMTTHSLSSVAYCEEEDLFFMEEGKIRKIQKKEIIEKLSDGVMTFNNAMSIIEQIQQSSKLILMVEGKTDKLHIENFYNLKNKKIPFKIIVCNGADNMKYFAIAFEQLKISQEKILFLCDYDKEGIKIYNQIKDKYNTIYTLDAGSLPKDDDKIRLKNYPIEMLYPLEILKKHNMITKISLNDFIKELSNDEQEQKSEEYKDKKDDKSKYQLDTSSGNTKKSNFATTIINHLDINKNFEEFKELIKRIEHFMLN
uniref:Uncharacterized protein n=1 Tax=uncultured Helicobacter sp. TaxID=175537 RepID=A0A650EKN5_9HELI|nr:hypothetical protein Helico6505_1520 [uncultured Helicobacter sp.]